MPSLQPRRCNQPGKRLALVAAVIRTIFKSACRLFTLAFLARWLAFEVLGLYISSLSCEADSTHPFLRQHLKALSTSWRLFDRETRASAERRMSSEDSASLPELALR